MRDEWTDRLSSYLDGDMEDDERSVLERHLESCPRCREVLREIEDIVRQARTLVDTPPAGDLWPLIARQVSGDARAARVPFFLRMAAGVALFLMSAALLWTAIGRERPQPPNAAMPVETSVVPSLVNDAAYDRAVTDLLRALDAGRGTLGPRTVAIVERSLATIDRAIAEATEALEEDPGNVFVSVHLARERQRKLALLRHVHGLASAGE
jgi:hypothetical protein